MTSTVATGSIPSVRTCAAAPVHAIARPEQHDDGFRRSPLGFPRVFSERGYVVAGLAVGLGLVWRVESQVWWTGGQSVRSVELGDCRGSRRENRTWGLREAAGPGARQIVSTPLFGGGIDPCLIQI